MNAFGSLYEKLKTGQYKNENFRSGESAEDQSESWFKEAESDPICPTLVCLFFNQNIKRTQ